LTVMMMVGNGVGVMLVTDPINTLSMMMLPNVLNSCSSSWSCIEDADDDVKIDKLKPKLQPLSHLQSSLLE